LSQHLFRRWRRLRSPPLGPVWMEFETEMKPIWIVVESGAKDVRQVKSVFLTEIVAVGCASQKTTLKCA
jgi:hypothetical protein